ncbi:hypothetical protein VP01_220g2 [Puccinia sorghi]|uniref:Dienelactone hydrolase domain-containing protein n=1 Tax=Puccinia sorghi TaxID=27349 RepID=A0A0L6V8X4_9BASI|nr:hypothetical protein VP01_220g2 [Puccinia sorghi]
MKLLLLLLLVTTIPMLIIRAEKPDDHRECLSGKATGKLITMNGVKVYAASAGSDRGQGKGKKAGIRKSMVGRRKAVLVFPDIFGIDLINIQLITDKLAADLDVPAFLVDTFSGDDVPDGPQPNAMPVGFDIIEWQKRHGPQQILPLIGNVIKNLTDQGVQRVAATGYCFGGKYVFLSLDRNWIQVGSTSHPSLLTIPNDPLELRAKSHGPLLINSCEFDPQFGAEAQKQTDAILGNGRYEPGYKRTYYPGASHGFGIRANLVVTLQKNAPLMNPTRRLSSGLMRTYDTNKRKKEKLLNLL